ncbi:MAG: helix-turn-helix transcriptional regulator [Desulfobacterales bacterium]|jgi:putative molybdopterin biosynthesis protein
MDELFSTKEVARFLNINEKMVYALVSEKGLPATKITGKWLFPRHLVQQWVEANTINYPEAAARMPAVQGLLIVAGSNDLLLDKTLSLYNRLNSGHVAVFGNLGSMGGLQALRKNICHIASSHLLQEDEREYNFEFAFNELDSAPAVLNFCRREQGILVAKGNPKKISAVADFGRPGIQIVNRSLGTGTRLLLDKELQKAGLKGEKIKGYTAEVARHLDVGLEILSQRADAGPGIKAVAGLLNLDFIPLRWERFDLMIAKDRFFEENIQRFLGLLHEKEFKDLVAEIPGYDLSLSGKMVFPPNTDH